MSDNSKIAWCDATWNPVTGCNRCSEGCQNCYAERMAKRLQAMGATGYVDGFQVRTHADVLCKPYQWKKSRRIFVCSMGDLFHEEVPFDFLEQVFWVMAFNPQHQFQLLTKRPHRMLAFYQSLGSEPLKQLFATFEHEDGEPDRVYRLTWPLPNVWVGVTAENQTRADERIPLLLQVPAVVRFVSVEPMLGPIDLRSSLGDTQWIGGQRGCAGQHQHSSPHVDGTPGDRLHHHHDDRCNPGLSQVICGGESGPKARPMDPAWVHHLKDQCVDADVPFFFKQWGGKSPKAKGSLLLGRQWKEFPGDKLR